MQYSLIVLPVSVVGFFSLLLIWLLLIVYTFTFDISIYKSLCLLCSDGKYPAQEGTALVANQMPERTSSSFITLQATAWTILYDM